jgi:hypothetical protein
VPTAVIASGADGDGIDSTGFGFDHDL